MIVSFDTIGKEIIISDCNVEVTREYPAVPAKTCVSLLGLKPFSIVLDWGFQ